MHNALVAARPPAPPHACRTQRLSASHHRILGGGVVRAQAICRVALRGPAGQRLLVRRALLVLPHLRRRPKGGLRRGQTDRSAHASFFPTKKVTFFARTSRVRGQRRARTDRRAANTGPGSPGGGRLPRLPAPASIGAETTLSTPSNKHALTLVPRGGLSGGATWHRSHRCSAGPSRLEAELTAARAAAVAPNATPPGGADRHTVLSAREALLQQRGRGLWVSREVFTPVALPRRLGALCSYGSPSYAAAACTATRWWLLRSHMHVIKRTRVIIR
jgi:hypothetical protein